VGTLAEVGRGKEKPHWVKAVLEGRNRNLAGATAPAHGLVLAEVFYGVGPREDPEDDPALE
jgi:tRNA pseudouridine38-40 synthase